MHRYLKRNDYLLIMTFYLIKWKKIILKVFIDVFINIFWRKN